MRQNLREPEGEIEKSMIISRYFDTLLLIIDEISRQKVSKNIEDLDSTTNQFYLLYIYIAPQPTEAEMLFSIAHNLPRETVFRVIK